MHTTDFFYLYLLQKCTKQKNIPHAKRSQKQQTTKPQPTTTIDDDPKRQLTYYNRSTICYKVRILTFLPICFCIAFIFLMHVVFDSTPCSNYPSLLMEQMNDNCVLLIVRATCLS